MTSNKKFIFLSVFITMGYVAFFVFSYVVKHVLGYDYPWGSFLFLEKDSYADFYDINSMLKDMSPYIQYDSSYPPFALILAIPFAFLQKKFGMLLSFSVFNIICFVVILCFQCKIIKQGVNIFSNSFLLLQASLPLLLTAPFVFMFDRGNYLLITIAFLYVFVYYYFVKPNDTLSSVMLALMIACKIYPALLLFVFLFDKKWKNILITSAISIGISLISLCFFKEGFIENLYAFLNNLFSFAGGHKDEAANVYFSVGLTALLRFPFVVWYGFNIPKWFPVGLIYVIISLILLIWTLWNIKSEKNTWKKMMILVVLMVFLMPGSYMYNLSYLSPLMIIFIIKNYDDMEKWEEYFYAICFGFLCIPKSYYYFDIDNNKYFDIEAYNEMYGGFLDEMDHINWIFPKDAVCVQVLLDGLVLFGIILFYNMHMKKNKSKKRI